MADVVVTGANRGIGLELCRQLAARGDRVLACCRSASEDLEALGVEILADVDVTSDAAVARLADHVADRPVDMLINNAGLLLPDGLGSLDFDGVRRQLEVNALGPLRVTAALRGRLGQGSKVAIVTSRMGSIEDNTSGGMYGYRMSKAAVNMAGRSLARDLERAGVAVTILHPGFVRTGMTGGQGFCDPPEAAAGLIARIDELTLATTGGFWHASGEALPW